ncbi:RraA family protein [Rhodovulum sulfidophilum]|uniref:RraA family protein n=1 Tax=Rhodovulum sulfidophilum TaxID=35806 RepID=UPI001922B4B0|nr:RraA family protein [Rhodovulum sulfidophilum]MBL3575955.1 RraA family protein [Rhodovulum sulfidophilum]MCE8431866.1 RraA family protein [Rhodovulum sulfidophilum]MCF4115688.1 RraA family protein [Rhodovulum sulfidophilum]
MTLGFRIHRRKASIDAAIANRFADLPVANVSDSMSRMTAAGSRLRPFYEAGRTMAGPALTVKVRPGDNLMLHKALDMAEGGDVIVVDAGGDLTNSIMGEIMAYIAQERNVAGIVIDGAIRDADEIRRCGLPVFAAGVTHRGPYKDGPGEINTTIAIDGMVIRPGDLILGDGDGVLCVPLEEAETVLAATEAKQAAEQKDIAAIRAGTIDRGWVDETLSARGCEFAD